MCQEVNWRPVEAQGLLYSGRHTNSGGWTGGYTQIFGSIKMSVFNKHTIKVNVSSYCQCPGTSAPNKAHLVVSLFNHCYGSSVRGGELDWKRRALFWLEKTFKGP